MDSTTECVFWKRQQAEVLNQWSKHSYSDERAIYFIIKDMSKTRNDRSNPSS